jgi:hypothetical protein
MFGGLHRVMKQQAEQVRVTQMKRTEAMRQTQLLRRRVRLLKKFLQ